MKTPSALFLITLLLLTSSLQGESPRGIDEITATPLFTENLFFLGWSPNGKVAYFTIDNIGGAAGFVPYVNLVVQDTVTDEILYNERIDESVPYLMKENSFKEQAQDFILENIPLLESLFQTHNINPFRTTTPKTVPFEHGGYTYDLHVLTKIVSRETQDFESPVYSVDALESIKIEISKGPKRKIIFNGTTEAGAIIYSIEPLGVVVSPFESRAVTFFVESIPDGDGGRKSRIQAIGAHLSRGF